MSTLPTSYGKKRSTRMGKESVTNTDLRFRVRNAARAARRSQFGSWVGARYEAWANSHRWRRAVGDEAQVHTNSHTVRGGREVRYATGKHSEAAAGAWPYSSCPERSKLKRFEESCARVRVTLRRAVRSCASAILVRFKHSFV